MKDWKDVANSKLNIEEGKYFVSEDGDVRTASKKPKKSVKDVRGREMVVLETADGDSVATYISDLLTQLFDAPDADNFNENALANSKGSTRRGSYHKVEIVNTDTNQVFKNYSDVVKAFGFSYDEFYNAFYTKKSDSIEFKGYHFEKRSISSEDR